MDEHNERALKRLTKSDNRFKFFLYLALVVLFSTVMATVVLESLLLTRIEDIAVRTEDSQKSNLCVSLIKPENRNTKNVTACVDQNRTKPTKNKTQFNDTTGKPIVSSAMRTIQPSLVIKPTAKPQLLIKLATVTEPQTCRAIETKLDPTLGLLYRYVGDTAWRIATSTAECP